MPKVRNEYKQARQDDFQTPRGQTSRSSKQPDEDLSGSSGGGSGVKKILIGALSILAVAGLCVIFFTVYLGKTQKDTDQETRPPSSMLNIPAGASPADDPSTLNDLKIIL